MAPRKGFVNGHIPLDAKQYSRRSEKYFAEIPLCKGRHSTLPRVVRIPLSSAIFFTASPTMTDDVIAKQGGAKIGALMLSVRRSRHIKIDGACDYPYSVKARRIRLAEIAPLVLRMKAGAMYFRAAGKFACWPWRALFPSFISLLSSRSLLASDACLSNIQ